MTAHNPLATTATTFVVEYRNRHEGVLYGDWMPYGEWDTVEEARTIIETPPPNLALGSPDLRLVRQTVTREEGY